MELARLALHAGRRAGRRLAVDIKVRFIWTGGDTVIDGDRGGAGLGDLAATLTYRVTRAK
jgi:hypothetical protein